MGSKGDDIGWAHRRREGDSKERERLQHRKVSNERVLLEREREGWGGGVLPCIMREGEVGKSRLSRIDLRYIGSIELTCLRLFSFLFNFL